MGESNLHKNEEAYLAKWLEGELSDDQLKQLVSEEDFLSYKKMELGLKVLEKPGASAFENIQKKIDTPKTKVRSLKATMLWGVSIAASIVLMISGYLFYSDNLVEVSTSYAEQKNVQLLDGSQVVLNAKSTLSYDEKNWANHRSVKLDGEAYFKVAKGSTFTVETSRGSVEVLGTEFNVNESLDYYEVVCYEGRVVVTAADESVVLLPGKSVRKINGNGIEKGRVTTSGPSWVLGESSFSSVPVRYVIDALEKQYQVRFDIDNIDSTVMYTGSFTNRNLEVALATVFNTMGINYQRKGTGIYILSLMNEE